MIGRYPYEVEVSIGRYEQIIYYCEFENLRRFIVKGVSSHALVFKEVLAFSSEE